LNTEGAIGLGRTIDTSTPTGEWWLTATPYPWTTIDGETLAWSQDVVWGNTIVWGTTLNVNETAWGSTIVWGTGTSWSSTIVWGTSTDVVWTDPESWANTIVWGTDTIGQSNGATIVWGTTYGLTPPTTGWGDLSGSTTATDSLAGQ
jgi:hypothetical protein